MANTTGNTPRGTSNRGFASMDPETQRKIAQKGGEASGGNRSNQNNPAQNTPTQQFGGNNQEGNR